MKQGFLIPVYRHAQSVGPLLKKLKVFNIPIILVDDGNEMHEKNLLAEYAASTPGLSLVTLEKNSGKGGALIKGFIKAAELGLTHVLQIDADGQHDLQRAAFFLEESKKNPEKIICAYPEFDETAPRSRVIARRISNFWAAVVTLSGEFRDVLCGFRVYPVNASLKSTSHFLLDKRMGFDPEILIRLYWNRVFPMYHPVKVIYPIDGISNFRVLRDNMRISWMFTRLCIGMFLRLPFLLLLGINRRKEI